MAILRELLEADLDTLFEFEQDEVANYMAAFVADDPSDKEAFLAHWAKIMANPNVINRTIEVDGKIAGSIACFEMFEQRQVGYRLGREFWGKGIATRALTEFLKEIPERPLYGRCVKDNFGSRRVLEKCSFKLIGEERAFAHGRGEDVDELIFRLD
jgi:RimJ/RimL family protein N-acetyltransferase